MLKKKEHHIPNHALPHENCGHLSVPTNIFVIRGTELANTGVDTC
jgi:hypothetical protein